MQIPISRRGGAGSTDLNFTVVGGTTQPENPKDNTIWVNTSTEIAGWSLSAEEPEAPIDGMVWVKTGFDKAFDFNAIKENVLTVYAQNAFQYVSGEWARTEAEIYQNAEWNKLLNKSALAEELNATGWARYSEGVPGEYVRQNARGFTRSSTLPILWCACGANVETQYRGYCMLAATEAALAITSIVGDSSSTSYLGNVVRGSVVLPSGNILYYAYAESAYMNTNINVTSNGTTYILEWEKFAVTGQHFVPSVTSGSLIEWAELMLF